MRRPTREDIVSGKYSSYYARSIGRIRNYLHDEATLGRAYGIFGVYLSQLEIHKSRIGKTGDYIIVEDDAIVSATRRIEGLYNGGILPSDWDMIQVSGRMKEIKLLICTSLLTVTRNQNLRTSIATKIWRGSF